MTVAMAPRPPKRRGPSRPRPRPGAALSRRLLDAAGFVGVSSIGFKRHSETGEVVLIEVNVRIPQSFCLGRRRVVAPVRHWLAFPWLSRRVRWRA